MRFRPYSRLATIINNNNTNNINNLSCLLKQFRISNSIYPLHSLLLGTYIYAYFHLFETNKQASNTQRNEFIYTYRYIYMHIFHLDIWNENEKGIFINLV